MNKTRLILILIIIYIAFMVACQKGQFGARSSSIQVSAPYNTSTHFSYSDVFMI